MSALRCALLAVPLWMPVTLVGQDSIPPLPTPLPLPSLEDSTPFRRGQWAAQFSGGITPASLGVLRFGSPNRALLFDVTLSGGHSKQTVQDTAGSQSTATSNVGFSARIGTRRYRPAGRAAVVYQTIGVSAGLSHSCFTSSGGSCLDGWNAGAFADLGGGYLVTPRLSLGGSVALVFSYQRFKREGPGVPTIRSWSYVGNLQGVTFVSTLYF